MKLSTNEVTLIGFVGGDAQAKQTRNKNNYTVVNLATQRLMEGQADRRMAKSGPNGTDW